MPDWTGRRFSSYSAHHSPDFLYRSVTIDFGYKGLPGFAFGRFYSVPGFGPDDTEIFYISRGRGGFYFTSTVLLLRVEFMHSSFSQIGSHFLDCGLLLGMVLFAILVRMSVKCWIKYSKSLG